MESLTTSDFYLADLPGTSLKTVFIFVSEMIVTGPKKPKEYLNFENNLTWFNRQTGERNLQVE